MSQTAKKDAEKGEGFTAEEKAAMKERAKELKAEARASKNKEQGESDCLLYTSPSPRDRTRSRMPSSA